MKEIKRDIILFLFYIIFTILLFLFIPLDA